MIVFDVTIAPAQSILNDPSYCNSRSSAHGEEEFLHEVLGQDKAETIKNNYLP